MRVMEEGQRQTSEGPLRPGQITVRISVDRMSADLLITPPEKDAPALKVEDALARLADAGVVYGIDEQEVERTVQQAQILGGMSENVGPITVARGVDPIPGEDSRIEYHPALTEARGKPKLLPNGSVDLYDLNLVHNVPQGTVLVTMIPATKGEPGTTVTGAEAKPRPGRDYRMRAGKGTTLSEDRLTIVAAVDGNPTLNQSEVAVTNVYRVSEDVGVATGNIQFVGSLVIGGSLERGFSVKAEGDVEIHGGVDGGIVEATGNVSVAFGIAGEAKVVAGGAVKARFIEGSTVKAGSNVWSAEGIIRSRVETAAGVEVLGRRGAIVGGQVMAKSTVTARILGSPMGAATEIAVGIVPDVRREMVQNQKERQAAEEEFDRIDRIVQFMVEQDKRGHLSTEKREMLPRLAKTQEERYTQLETLKARNHELEQMCREALGAGVQAKDVCYPGVTVVIGNARYRTEQQMQRIKFRLDDTLEVEAVSL